MHCLVAVEMEPDKYRVRAVPDSRGDAGDSGPRDPGPSANGFPNGDVASSRHAPLRTALSREENEDEPPVAHSVDDGERNNMETRPCPKYRSCRERACSEFDANAPSGSGVGLRRVHGAEEEEGRRRSRKRAAECHAERSNLEADPSSSDTSNDDYSLGSEDGCIYTYRGGEHLADLPSSFFSLDMGLPRDRHLPVPPPYAPRPGQEPVEERRGSRASSPDMDFLEMDFDPGPSCDADSGDESSSEEDLDASPSPEAVARRGTTPDEGLAQHPVAELPAVVVPPVPDQAASAGAEPCQPSTSHAGAAAAPVRPVSAVAIVSGEGKWVRAGAFVSHTNARGERLLVRRTCRRWPPRPPVTHHTASGDLICERGEVAGGSGAEVSSAADRVNLSSALYHCTMAKRLIVEKPTTNFLEGADTSNLSECEVETEVGAAGEGSVSEAPRCMIWSEREACERQVTQIGTSACGATAVINVFSALGIPIDVEKINKAIGTRQRANNAPIPRYLLSRAVAGCTAAGLVAGLQQASGGLLTARFFPTYPERVLSLSHWLADWISLGAVPVATLNLQAGYEGHLPEEEIPDAWHHQMVFGVSPRGVFLTNPVECVLEEQLWPQLCSESVLLVRSRDVLARLAPHTDLAPLAAVPDPRWASYNVLGQGVNVVRELRACEAGGGGAAGGGGGGAACARGVRSRHVRVPCAYRAGVTLAALTGSEAHRRLTRAPHLPLLADPL